MLVIYVCNVLLLHYYQAQSVIRQLSGPRPRCQPPLERFWSSRAPICLAHNKTPAFLKPFLGIGVEHSFQVGLLYTFVVGDIMLFGDMFGRDLALLQDF